LATAEARQEANAKAGLGAGNPARGGSSGSKTFDMGGGATITRTLSPELQRDLEQSKTPTAQQRAKEQADRILAEADAERGKAALRRGGLNPQQTQRAKDDIAAVAPAGTPGPTFDSRSGFKGPKYQGYRKVTVVAQDVRRDLKDAVANGELPQGLKFSVKSDSRGTNAVRVRVSGSPKTRDDYGRLTGEAKAVYDKVDSIVNAYNRDNSDIMTDYFDVDYYGTVQLDD
jgi:hypothetical protein